MNKVQIDSKQCRKIGRQLKAYSFRPSFYQRPFVHNNFSIDLKVKTILYSVAICHQTQNFKLPQKNLYGWEVIEYVFLKMMHSKDQLFDTQVIINGSESQLETHLVKLFSADGNLASSFLDRSQERSHLLFQLMEWLHENYSGSGEKLLFAMGSDVKCWYKTLAENEAYSDPLFKKASFMLKLLNDLGLIHIGKNDDFIPIMDYHMQRVLLRTGAVQVLQPELGLKLKERIAVDDEPEIREACIRAIRIIAESSGIDLPKMNNIFWPLGRSCCNERPKCTGAACEKNPCTLSLVVDTGIHKECILAGCCQAIKDPEFLKFWQPVVHTHFY